MSNIFDFFSKIYCINLTRRTDRRKHMQSLFDRFDISDRVNWFDAIETPQDGRVGCRLSHLKIIKLAKEDKLDNALIFEDDIVPSPDFNLDKLNKSINTVQSIDWDIFYMGGRVIEPATDINEFLFKSSLWSAASLCINNTAFEKCMELEAYNGPVDWFYSSPVQNFNCYSSNPCMFIQHPKFDSDLTSTATDRRDTFLESYTNRHNATAPNRQWTQKEISMYSNKQ